jgi:endonuclease YncB( thermonuclease family)
MAATTTAARAHGTATGVRALGQRRPRHGPVEAQSIIRIARQPGRLALLLFGEDRPGMPATSTATATGSAANEGMGGNGGIRVQALNSSGSGFVPPVRSPRHIVDAAGYLQLILALFAGAALAVPAGIAFDCTPVRVWDGDGPIWCAEGPRVRLSGIAAREIDGTCRGNQPCPEATAEESRDALVDLIGGKTGTSPEGHILVRGPALRCLSTGGAGGSRTGAWCVSPKSGDLSCAMVRGGWALKWDRYWHDHRC